MDQSMRLSLRLPWNQAEHYWICLVADESELAEMTATLEVAGMTVEKVDGALAVRAPRQWGDSWGQAKEAMSATQGFANARVAVIPGGDIPSPQLIEMNAQPVEQVDRIASSLWLGEALLQERIECYLQPVIDRRGKPFGYESFARIVEEDGSVIGGGKIIGASAGLQAEYAVDRYLHVQSIRSFINTELSGVLFINFVPGFIHRPEKYLEKLSDTAQALGLAARHIVLDITRTGGAFESVHLRGIFDYCMSKGYAVALDDVDSVETARHLLEIGKPDYLKLDMQLVQQLDRPEKSKVVEYLVALARNAGCTVIAEGVENEATHKALLALGVDLFQGYYFSPPVEAQASRGKAPKKDAG